MVFFQSRTRTQDLIPIWLDCDTGHDDAFAILLAATHPRANLLGVSTVFGNASLAHVTYNTRAILKAIGRDDVAVYPGAVGPFCREVAHASDIHGETGLDGTTCLPKPTVPARTDKPAVHAMAEALLATQKETAWIVATGSTTNVALLLSIYPHLIEHIAGISIMGGAVGGGFAPLKPGQDDKAGGRIGNWTDWAEFNIYIDPESARSVLSNSRIAAKTILVPLDVTHQFVATTEVQNALLHGSHSNLAAETTGGTELRKLFVEILTFFAKTYADVFGMTEGPPLHDPLAVAVVLAPELFVNPDNERFYVDIITDGDHGDSQLIRSGPSQCGRTVLTPMQEGGGRGVLVPRTLDTAAVWKMIDDMLSLTEVRLKNHS